jgi:hypothetical protein
MRVQKGAVTKKLIHARAINNPVISQMENGLRRKCLSDARKKDT